MNEQECLQRIMDVLSDNIAEMSEIDYGGSLDSTYINSNIDGIQTVAKEITAIFKQLHKDTRSRREKALDMQFAAMGVKPRVYHFTKDVEPFRAITIATERIWDSINGKLIYVDRHHRYPLSFRPATILRKELQREGVYGIAICYKRDQYNKRYGRNKAKGKLIQHLLKEAQKE